MTRREEMSCKAEGSRQPASDRGTGAENDDIAAWRFWLHDDTE